jgi:hypothetical protein
MTAAIEDNDGQFRASVYFDSKKVVLVRAV